MNNPVQQQRDFIKSNILKSFQNNLDYSVPQLTEYENIDLMKSLHTDFLSGNIDEEIFDKAMSDISRFKKVKKVVHQGGKTFLRSYHVSGGKVEDNHHHEVELPEAVPSLQHGDKVNFERNGSKVSGHVIDLKHHPLTDRYGTAVIHDGENLHSVSLKRLSDSSKVNNEVEQDEEMTKQKVKISGIEDSVIDKIKRRYDALMQRDIDPKVIKQSIVKDFGLKLGQFEQIVGDGSIEKSSHWVSDWKTRSPLGETKSGKTIYPLRAHYKEYSNFTKQDHKDAIEMHEEISNTLKKENPRLSQVHQNYADTHALQLTRDNLAKE